MTEPLNRLDAALGRMAVERLLLTPAQLEAAVEELLHDASEGRPRPLGTVLVARGFLTDRQLLMLFDAQAKAPAQAGQGPTALPVPAGEGGVKKDSLALCHQVTTLDRRMLAVHIGTLPPERLRRIGDGLRIAQGLL